jgi:ferredoxin-NADP reductase
MRLRSLNATLAARGAHAQASDRCVGRIGVAGSLAGGIGVTPLIAMGHELRRSGADFALYYRARTRAQAAFNPELERVSWRDRVEFFFGDERRLNVGDIINNCRDGDYIYTCDPAGFMNALYAAATSRGLPDEALHRECSGKAK